jgi:hypothetical protein
MLKQPPIRPLCEDCKKLPARQNGVSALGYARWQRLCNTCHRKKYDKKDKEDSCTRCGFIAVDSCQLCYVDEETICHNCNAIELKKKRRHKELTVDATVDWNNLRL